MGNKRDSSKKGLVYLTHSSLVSKQQCLSSHGFAYTATANGHWLVLLLHCTGSQELPCLFTTTTCTTAQVSGRFVSPKDAIVPKLCRESFANLEICESFLSQKYPLHGIGPGWVVHYKWTVGRYITNFPWVHDASLCCKRRAGKEGLNR